MKKLLPLFFLLAITYAQAQVGIGTTNPDPSSALDITATNKGFIAPRVFLNTISNNSIDGTNPNAIGLMIYNTNPAVTSGNGVGYYFWNGSSWLMVKSSATDSQQWSVTGNSSATGAFLGTVNAQPLNFRINNVAVGSFKIDNSLNLGISSVTTGTNALAVGFEAEATADNAAAFGRNAEAIGLRATAIGYNSNAGGDESSAIGNTAVATATRATAIGYQATASGSNGVAVGSQSRAQTDDALAFGRQATANGSNTTAVGNSASATALNSSAFGTGATASGSGATAIGKGAVASQNRSIILGDATDTNVTVGIGTSSPTARLQVNGTLRYVDATPGDDNNKVLTSDANGNASWQSISGIPQIVAAGLVVPAGGTATTFTTPKLFGATVSRTSKGIYQVTFSSARPSANYIINLANVDCNGNCDGSDFDDPAIAYRNRTATGFTVVIGDNDNGGTDRDKRDLEFTFTVVDF
ncbi:hypothetical protein [Aequorivita echinoideorum]|uniref:Trimeric autotransporter adhesin YadA-like head domain-containing protein n=1 Tax=Aequorivita echinoideorum TaxID=1549647 RepID=A0ABS5S2W4_9FLAO|nr:hypothetical protein [Aequorivita echinoideorum]MBT0607552.1 hypothetical protein [Aequorivita echinoideorum]